MSPEATAAVEHYRRFAENPGCSEHVRSVAASVVRAIEAAESILARESRIPTDPAGHALVRPGKP